jgi:hypothetical protein
MRGPSRFAAALLAVTATTAAAAQSAADGWVGQVRCVLAASEPTSGYQDTQTQKWVVTGPPVARNDFRDYPVTWNVSGGGSQEPRRGAAAGAGAAETWTRSGSDSSGSITLFVPVGTTTMRIAAGQRPLKTVAGVRAPNGQTSDADEWRFPYIDVKDGVTQTRLRGSRTRTGTELVGWRQPANAAVTETCSWSLDRANATASASPGSAAQTRYEAGLAAHLAESLREAGVEMSSDDESKLLEAMTKGGPAGLALAQSLLMTFADADPGQLNAQQADKLMTTIATETNSALPVAQLLKARLETLGFVRAARVPGERTACPPLLEVANEYERSKAAADAAVQSAVERLRNTAAQRRAAAEKQLLAEKDQALQALSVERARASAAIQVSCDQSAPAENERSLFYGTLTSILRRLSDTAAQITQNLK